MSVGGWRFTFRSLFYSALALLRPSWGTFDRTLRPRPPAGLITNVVADLKVTGQ
jgi:hypothetical protein